MSYKIEPTSYGFKVTFTGFIQVSEMAQWVEESIKTLRTCGRSSFACLIDMSTMGSLPQDSKAELAKGQSEYKKRGMNRSAVLVPTRLIAKQLRDMATSSGILGAERYISIEDHDAEAKARLYCEKGIEPPSSTTNL